MVFSIALLLVTLLITLDSIGSKRLRAKVIRLGRQFFAEANGPTLRMRYKAAVRREGRKSWQPIEAKLFLTTEPWRVVSYEDRTPGFLVSQKVFRLVDGKDIEQEKKILSLFPQSSPPPSLTKMHQWAFLPWLPDHPDWELVQWAVHDSVSKSGKYTKDGMELIWRMESTSEQISSFQATMGETGVALRYEYNQYETMGNYQVPMAFTIEEEYSGQKYQYRCDVIDLVYDEDFAWW
jgi:hypothetical protein